MKNLFSTYFVGNKSKKETKKQKKQIGESTQHHTSLSVVHVQPFSQITNLLLVFLVVKSKLAPVSDGNDAYIEDDGEPVTSICIDSPRLGRRDDTLTDRDKNTIADFGGEHHLAREVSHSNSSSETGMARLILFLSVMKLVLTFKKTNARKLKTVIPKNVWVWKIAMLVSALGCLLTCGVAEDEYRVHELC